VTGRESTVGTLGKTTLLFAAVLAPFQAASISPAIPELLAHFADQPNAAYLARLVLVMPSIGIAISAPLAGAVIDRFGRRRFLLWAILAYAIFGASGGFADSLEVLLLTRLLLGFAAGGAMTATVTLMGDYFDGPERQKFLGQRTAFVNFSAIAINLSGGLLASIDWRVPFFVFLVALVLVPMGMRSLPEPIVSAESKATPRLRFREWPLAFIALVYAMLFFVNIAFFFVPTQIPFYVRSLGYDGAQIGGFALSASSLGIALGSLLYHPIRTRVSQAASTFVPAAFLVVAGFGVVFRRRQRQRHCVGDGRHPGTHSRSRDRWSDRVDDARAFLLSAGQPAHCPGIGAFVRLRFWGWVARCDWRCFRRQCAPITARRLAGERSALCRSAPF